MLTAHQSSFMPIFLLASFFHLDASAQAAYEGCTDFNGTPVPSVANSSLNDVASASMTQFGPLIQYNPYVVASMAMQTRGFFYAHECGHHALGHTIGSTHPLAMEQAADCFAIRYLVKNGKFDSNDVEIVQAELAYRGKSDWMHLPGPLRAINLKKCLTQPPAVIFASDLPINSDVENSVDEEKKEISDDAAKDEKTGCYKKATPYSYIPEKCKDITVKSL
jgi:hypothetical protein